MPAIRFVFGRPRRFSRFLVRRGKRSDAWHLPHLGGVRRASVRVFQRHVQDVRHPRGREGIRGPPRWRRRALLAVQVGGVRARQQRVLRRGVEPPLAVAGVEAWVRPVAAGADCRYQERAADALLRAPVPRAAGVEAVPEFDEEEVMLQGFQALCREVGKTPGNTVWQCDRILKNTLVNIIDLIDARRKGIPPKVWHTLEEFRRYTLAPPGDKKIPWREANKDPLLRCFLQNFGARPGDRCLGEIDRCSPYSRARFPDGVDTYIPDNRDRFTGGGDSYIPDNRDRCPGGFDCYIPDSRARLGGGNGLPSRDRSEGGNRGVAARSDPGPEGHDRMEVERDRRAEEDRDRVAVERDQKREEGQDLAAVEGAKVEKDDGSSDVIGAQGSEDKSVAVVQVPRGEENHVGATVKSPEVEEDGDDCVAGRTRSRTSDVGVAETVKSEEVSGSVVVKQEGKRGRGRPKGSKNRPADGDDSVVVKKIRPAEEQDGSPDCGREAKKVVKKWYPESSIMQRFISSA